MLFISELLCDVKHPFAGKLMPTVIFFPLFGTLCPPILWELLFFKTFSEAVEAFQKFHAVPDMLL